ncbi:unnamed protein product, partial [Mesorhabditis spiculigera]
MRFLLPLFALATVAAACWPPKVCNGEEPGFEKDRHLLHGEGTDHETAHLVGHPSRRYCSSPLDCKPGESCRKFKKVLAFNTGQCLPIQSPGK